MDSDVKGGQLNSVQIDFNCDKLLIIKFKIYYNNFI